MSEKLSQETKASLMSAAATMTSATWIRNGNKSEKYNQADFRIKTIALFGQLKEVFKDLDELD